MTCHRLFSILIVIVFCSSISLLSISQAETRAETNAKTPVVGTADKEPPSAPSNLVAPARSEDRAQVRPGSLQDSAPAKTTLPSDEPDQVIATINGVKIRRSDLERELRFNGRNLENEELTVERRDKIISNMITDILVEQYLRENNHLNDQALLDSLYSAKLISNFEYFVQIIGQKQKPLEESEINQFISEHPDFFQDRRSWEFVDISMPLDPDIDVNKIQSFVDTLNNDINIKDKKQKKEQREINKNSQQKGEFNNILSYLQGRKIFYADFRGIKNSEEINPEILEKLKAMQPGQYIKFVDTANANIHVIKLNKSLPSPVEIERVRSGVIRGLYITRASEAVKEILDQMRANVEIKFLENITSRADQKKITVKNTKEIVEEKVNKEFEKTKLLVKQMQEMANEKIRIDAIKRQNKRTAQEIKKDIEDQSLTKSGKTWLRYASNIWILALPILFSVAFYHFLRQTEENLTAYINESESVKFNTVEQSVQRFLLSPPASWGIGVIFFWILAQTSWTKFIAMNYSVMTKQLMEWGGLSLGLSLACIWLIAKTYRFFPQFLRNWRFLFLGLIAIIQIAMLNTA